MLGGLDGATGLGGAAASVFQVERAIAMHSTSHTPFAVLKRGHSGSKGGGWGDG